MSRRILLAFLLTSCAAPLLAGFTVQLKTVSKDAALEAEFHEGRLMVDLIQAAEALGAKTDIRDGEYVLVFSSGTAVVNPDSAIYRVRAAGEKKWHGAGLETPPYYSGSRLMVAMDALPVLTFRTFTYHLQKKELTEDAALLRDGLPPDKRAVPARHVSSNQKDWVSLDDAARGLGVVLYSARAQSYSLVLPDFTILEVTVGAPWVSRKGVRYKPLEDPILLFSGVPYATLSAVSTLFGIDASWDASAGALVVPARYGRLATIKPPDRKPLTVVGYLPHPLRASLDEMSLFYQNPGPTYLADQPGVYESVRDFVTNGPLDPGTHGYDRMSGNAVMSLDGSALSRPLTGGVRVEKVGTRGRVVSGDLQWGFPGLQLKGAREYLNMGDFSGQFALVDNVSVSHANDAYGEGTVNPSWRVKALYGESLFAVFVSTDILSQAVDFRQKITGGAWEGSWKPSAGRTLSASLTQYHFENHVRQTVRQFNLLGDPLLDSVLIEVGQAESPVLTSALLTPKHDTSMMSLEYKAAGLFKAGASGAMSRYRDVSTRKPVLDDDWRVNATLGDRGSRVAASYERVGPRYRSLGAPTTYQDRRITRVSPYLDLARYWKVYGEFRREDFHGGVPEAGLSAFRSDFIYLSNGLSFPSFSLRALASKYDNSLFGKQWSSDLDYTKYLGRNSLDLGSTWSSQWYAVGGLFRQSYTGRLGGQILRPSWKLTAGEDLTLNHYPRLGGTAVPRSRWQTSTHVLAQAGEWETFLQYNLEPRYYNDREIIHTGYFRVGRQVGRQKILNLFYAVTSLAPGLKSPEVWRAGLEYVNDFF
jgi:hypothetical protein